MHALALLQFPLNLKNRWVVTSFYADAVCCFVARPDSTSIDRVRAGFIAFGHHFVKSSPARHALLPGNRSNIMFSAVLLALLALVGRVSATGGSPRRWAPKLTMGTYNPKNVDW
jgi:hypothetical protein